MKKIFPKLRNSKKLKFQRIITGDEVHGSFVIQLISSKKIGGDGGDGKTRYRFVISDGKTLHMFAILGTEMNHMQESGQLEDMSIVRVNRHVVSTVNRNEVSSKRVIILFELELLHPGSGKE